jgi:hypothetical protein
MLDALASHDGSSQIVYRHVAEHGAGEFSLRALWPARLDTNVCSRTLPGMDPAHFALAVPDDPELLARLTAALAAQADPPIAVDRAGTAVLAFSCDTWGPMLRSRVMQALETAVGPEWQHVVTPID